MNATPPNDIADDDRTTTDITSSCHSARGDHQESESKITSRSKSRQTDGSTEHTNGREMGSGSGLNCVGLLRSDQIMDGTIEANATTCDVDNALLAPMQPSLEMAHATIPDPDPDPVIEDDEEIGAEFIDFSSIDGVVAKTSITVVKEILIPTATSTSTSASATNSLALAPHRVPLPVASAGLKTHPTLSLRPPPSLSFDGGFSISSNMSRRSSQRDSLLTHKDKNKDKERGPPHRTSGNAKQSAGTAIQRKNVAPSSALTGDAMHSSATLPGTKSSSRAATSNNSNVKGTGSTVPAKDSALKIKKKKITAANGSDVTSPSKSKNKIGRNVIRKDDVGEVEVEEEALEEEYRMLRMRLESNVYDAVADRRKEFQLRENARTESSLKGIRQNRDVEGRGSETEESIRFKDSAAAGRIGIAVQGGGPGQGVIRQNDGQTHSYGKEHRHRHRHRHGQENGNGQKDDRLLDDIEKMSAGDILSYFQTQDDLDGDDEEEEEEYDDMQEGESGEEEEDEEEDEEEEEEGGSDLEHAAIDGSEDGDDEKDESKEEEEGEDEDDVVEEGEVEDSDDERNEEEERDNDEGGDKEEDDDDEDVEEEEKGEEEEGKCHNR